MVNLIRYFLLIARRDHVLLALIAAIIVAFGGSMFFGWTSIDEIRKAQISYYAGSARFVLAFGIIIFISFFIRRLFENKEVDLFLSYPISRGSFLLGLFLSFCVIISILVFCTGLLMLYYFWSLSITGFFAWVLSLFLEMLILASCCIFFSVMIESVVVSVFSVTAFYIASRSMGYIISSISSPSDKIYIVANGGIQKVIDVAVTAIGVCFPRIDLFSYSSWLIYGVDDVTGVYVYVIQSIVYIPLIIFAALTDFKKRNF